MEQTSEEALMAELNGVATVAPVDSRPTEEKVDPLEVRPPAATPAVAALANKAKALGGARGYAVTVEGEFYVASKESPSKKLKQPYRIVVNLPSLTGALSTIKNKLLDKMLRMKYPGYAGFRTHEIVEAKALTADTPMPNNVAFMDEPKLRAFIADREIPIPADRYAGDVKNLRASVTDFLLNPKGFEEREQKRVAAIAEDKALAELNDLPADPAGATAPATDAV